MLPPCDHTPSHFFHSDLKSFRTKSWTIYKQTFPIVMIEWTNWEITFRFILPALITYKNVPLGWERERALVRENLSPSWANTHMYQQSVHLPLFLSHSPSFRSVFQYLPAAGWKQGVLAPLCRLCNSHCHFWSPMLLCHVVAQQT